MSWATPRRGIKSNGRWARALFAHWNLIKPKKYTFAYLFPKFDTEWVIHRQCRGTSGMTQAALVKLEQKLGFEPRLKLHSPRNWYATLANQLLMEPDKREKLGRWKKGSVMPEIYDRTVCVTELEIRNQILEKIDLGWLPCASFEIPKPVGKTSTKTLTI